MPEQEGQQSMCAIRSQKDLVDSFFNVLCMSPPFRNYTTRLFCRLIKVLEPQFHPNPDQWKKLLQALLGVIDLII